MGFPLLCRHCSICTATKWCTVTWRATTCCWAKKRRCVSLTSVSPAISRRSFHDGTRLWERLSGWALRWEDWMERELVDFKWLRNILFENISCKGFFLQASQNWQNLLLVSILISKHFHMSHNLEADNDIGTGWKLFVWLNRLNKKWNHATTPLANHGTSLWMKMDRHVQKTFRAAKIARRRKMTLLGQCRSVFYPKKCCLNCTKKSPTFCVPWRPFRVARETSVTFNAFKQNFSWSAQQASITITTLSFGVTRHISCVLFITAGPVSLECSSALNLFLLFWKWDWNLKSSRADVISLNFLFATELLIRGLLFLSMWRFESFWQQK